MIGEPGRMSDEFKIGQAADFFGITSAKACWLHRR